MRPQEAADTININNSTLAMVVLFMLAGEMKKDEKQDLNTCISDID